MRQKFLALRGQTRYALRRATEESVFGQVKQGGAPAQRFGPGAGEVATQSTGHNLLKLFQYGTLCPVLTPRRGFPAWSVPSPM